MTIHVLNYYLFCFILHHTGWATQPMYVSGSLLFYYIYELILDLNVDASSVDVFMFFICVCVCVDVC